MFNNLSAKPSNNKNLLLKIIQSTGKIKINENKITGALWTIFRLFLLVGLCYVLLYPIIFMLSSSFKPVAQNYDPSVIWIPKSLTLDNIRDVLKVINIKDTLKNTFLISGVSALLQLVSCMLVGYGFARFKFRGKNLLFGMVILSLIVPPQLISIPLYIQFRNFDILGLLSLVNRVFGTEIKFNLIDSYWVFYLPSIFGMGLRSGLFIYVFRQFFRGMSKELEDASAIDGCSPFKTFISIMLPNAGPAILTVFLFTFVWQWNDYYAPAMYFSEKTTISTALASIRTNLRLLTNIGNNYLDPYVVSTRIQAACLISIAPIVTMYVFTQKHFTESIERTGIK